MIYNQTKFLYLADIQITKIFLKFPTKRNTQNVDLELNTHILTQKSVS